MTLYSLLDTYRRFGEPAAHIVGVNDVGQMFLYKFSTLVPHNLIRV